MEKPKGKVSVTSFGSCVELRIHGFGSSRKGDRWVLLSQKEARHIAYDLLMKAEHLASSEQKAA